MERRGWAIRTGTIKGQLATGGARRIRWRAAALRDGTSRVMGDLQARICEGLGVKFPGPIRRPKPESGILPNERAATLNPYRRSKPQRDAVGTNSARLPSCERETVDACGGIRPIAIRSPNRSPAPENTDAARRPHLFCRGTRRPSPRDEFGYPYFEKTFFTLSKT